MTTKESDDVRLYEGMFLFDSNLASKDWPGLERHVEELLKRNAAELVFSERWPDRKLAFEIKGCKKGAYYLTYFHAKPQSIPGLERDCQLSERVLRLLTIQEEGLEEELERCRSRASKQGEKEKEESASAASSESPRTGSENSRETPSEPAGVESPSES